MCAFHRSFPWIVRTLDPIIKLYSTVQYSARQHCIGNNVTQCERDTHRSLCSLVLNAWQKDNLAQRTLHSPPSVASSVVTVLYWAAH